MLYDESHSITQEMKKKLCDELQYEGVSQKKICLRMLDVFSMIEDHVSVDEFQGMLSGHDISLSRELTEAFLETVTRFGFAIKLHLEGDEVVRYEHLHPKSHHDHFMCVQCKKIMEFTNDQLENIQEALIFKKGCRPLFHKLEVYGICDACAGTFKKYIPVTHAKEDTVVIVHSIASGTKMRRRLMELGFIEGEAVTVIKNSDFGPVVLGVKGSRFALGRGEAQKILVYEQ